MSDQSVKPELEFEAAAEAQSLRLPRRGQGLSLEEALRELDRLGSEDSEYDADLLKPSPEVFSTVRRLLKRLDALLDRPVSQPVISTTEGGALIVQWGDVTRYVRLFAPAQISLATVYTRDGEKRQAIRPATAQGLAKALRRLTDE